MTLFTLIDIHNQALSLSYFLIKEALKNLMFIKMILVFFLIRNIAQLQKK